MVLIFFTLFALIIAAIYGAMAYKNECSEHKDRDACKFSHRTNDYEFDPRVDSFDHGQLYVNESVDFIVIIIAVGFCAIWWVSSLLVECTVSHATFDIDPWTHLIPGIQLHLAININQPNFYVFMVAALIKHKSVSHFYKL